MAYSYIWTDQETKIRDYKYKIIKERVKTPSYWEMLSIPLIKKGAKIEYKDVEYLIVDNKKINLTSEDWKLTKKRVNDKRSIFLYYDGENYNPISLRKQGDEYAKEAIDSDLTRNFITDIKQNQELTTNKWDKLLKMGFILLAIVILFLLIFLGTVYVGKISNDQIASLKGVVQSGGSWFNSTISALGG